MSRSTQLLEDGCSGQSDQEVAMSPRSPPASSSAGSLRRSPAQGAR